MFRQDNASGSSSQSALHGSGDTGGQPAQASTGIDTVNRQPEGMQNGLPAGEPTGEGSVGGAPPVQDINYFKGELEKSQNQYKEIQSLSDKRYNELQTAQGTMSQFEKFGGPEQLLQWAEYLNNNPRFNEFIQSEQRSKYGIDTTNMDQKQSEAIKTVETIARQIASEEVAQIRKNEVDPLVQRNQQAHVQGLFGQMDTEFPEWRDVQDQMEELSENLSPEKQANPTLKDIKMLYYSALDESGKFQDFQAQQYQKVLEGKKNNASDPPPTNYGSADVGPVNSLLEAFQKSKQQHGVTGEVLFR